MLTRRGFLGLLGGAGAAAVVAPTYFFAPVGGWKSDVIVNPIDDVRVYRMANGAWLFETPQWAFDWLEYLRNTQAGLHA